METAGTKKKVYNNKIVGAHIISLTIHVTNDSIVKDDMDQIGIQNKYMVWLEQSSSVVQKQARPRTTSISISISGDLSRQVMCISRGIPLTSRRFQLAMLIRAGMQDPSRTPVVQD